MGLYRWSKNCYFEFFIVLLNPFWYYCTLFPCYSTVVSYYCPLLPCYSTLKPYYLPFLPCYSTLSACYSTVRSNYSSLILLISLHLKCVRFQTQEYIFSICTNILNRSTHYVSSTFGSTLVVFLAQILIFLA